MKTQMKRVMVLGLAVCSLTLCAACEEDQARAETPTSTDPDNNPSASEVASVARSAIVPTAPNAGAETPLTAPPGAATNAAPATPSLPAATGGNAPAGDPKKPALPQNVRITPALAEVVKLAQAGVSEEVLLTYVSNSTNVFELTADEIVYLNDLGVPSSVLTVLIQHDASAETLARKQAAGAAKPLSPELALTKPATNVYPNQTPPASAPAGFSAAQEPVVEPPVYVDAPATEVGGEPAQPVTSVDYFYSALAPYGTWVDVPDYGRCWQPTVAVVNSYWRPYADCGRWYWSDSGWYWHSYYSWGWAPFHYGRWHSSPSYGWVWTPDTYWGPSWVTWRSTPYYCGWAPLPPRCHYVNGFGLYYGGSSVSVGFGFGYGYDDYTWIHNSYMCDPYPHHYFVAAGHSRTIYAQSTPANKIFINNGTIINQGVGVERVARVSRSEIRKVTVREEPLAASRGVRYERYEQNGDTPVIVRPRLPERPPSLVGAPATGGAPRVSAPAARGTAADGEKTGVALAPSANRRGSGTPRARSSESWAGRPENDPPGTIRMPSRRETASARSVSPPVVIADGNSGRSAVESVPAPAPAPSPAPPPPADNRDTGRRRTPGTTGIASSASIGNNFDSSFTATRSERPASASVPTPARSGVPGAAPMAPSAPSVRSAPAAAPAPSVPRTAGSVPSISRTVSAPPPAASYAPSTPPARRAEPVAAPVSRPAPSAPPVSSAPMVVSAPRVEVSRPAAPPPPAPRVEVSRPVAPPPAAVAPPPARAPSPPPAAPPSSSRSSGSPSQGRRGN